MKPTQVHPPGRWRSSGVVGGVVVGVGGALNPRDKQALPTFWISKL